MPGRAVEAGGLPGAAGEGTGRRFSPVPRATRDDDDFEVVWSGGDSLSSMVHTDDWTPDDQREEELIGRRR